MTLYLADSANIDTEKGNYINTKRVFKLLKSFVKISESHSYDLVDSLGVRTATRIKKYQGEDGEQFLKQCTIIKPGDYQN